MQGNSKSKRMNAIIAWGNPEKRRPAVLPYGKQWGGVPGSLASESKRLDNERSRYYEVAYEENPYR